MENIHAVPHKAGHGEAPSNPQKVRGWVKRVTHAAYQNKICTYPTTKTTCFPARGRWAGAGVRRGAGREPRDPQIFRWPQAVTRRPCEAGAQRTELARQWEP